METTMRKSLILAASLATMAFSATAFAAAMDAKGVIKSIDTMKHTITLADGKLYDLPANFDAKKLKVGEKVNVAYNIKGGKMIATSVKAAN
jgi:Cu/Ag efflux protein CusF